MTEERPIDWIAEIAQLLPGAMRSLFVPPAERSPLGELPPPQVQVLVRLRQGASLPMNEVARSLGVAMSTATQVADRWERLGLVERQGDPADRRVVRLALTEAGRAALAEHVHEREARIAGAMRRLSPAEREVVLNGLRLLETAARAGEPAPAMAGRHPLQEMIAAALPGEK